jgi:hypothetical protein
MPTKNCLLSALPGLLLAGTALSVATPAFADGLVVRSTGPSAASYPVGRRLPETGRVVLRAGDRVVIVSASGTRTLSGPGNFPVRAGAIRGQSSRATLGRYIASGGGGTISRTGAVRGDTTADAPRTPNVWVVDISRGGTFCVADPSSLNLWRPDLNSDTLLTVERTDMTTPRQNLAFVTGQSLRLWPVETMPVSDGARYRLSGAGRPQPIEVQFALTPNPPADAGTLANLLADRGCMAQLAQLGERMDEAGAR